MGAALWAVVCAAEPVCSLADVCGVPGTVLLSACAGSSVSGCTVSAAGGSLLRHNGHTAKAGAKAQRRQQCAEKRSPIPQSPVGCWYRFS